MLIFFEMGLANFASLASNLQSSCLYLLTSWDYRHLPLCPSNNYCLSHAIYIFAQELENCDERKGNQEAGYREKK
jgi:hypothetical protein